MRTMFRGVSAVGGSLLIAASAAAAAEPVAIKFKWTQGEPVVYRMTQDIAGTMTMSGQPPMQTSQKQVTTTSMDVQSIAEDGAATVKVTTDAVRMEMQQPMMGEIVYDSSDPDTDTSNPMAQAFSVMVGESYTMVVTPMGEVRKVEGMDRIFDKLTDQMNGPEMVEAMKQNLGDEAMRAMMENAFRAWTVEGVEPGDTWTVQLKQPLPMVGTMTSDSTMTLKEVTTVDGRRIARIGTTVKMTLDAEGAEVPGMPPGVEITMDGGTGEGETLFDLDRGQLHTMRLVMEMPMEIKMGEGMSIKQDMTSTTLMERVDPAAKEAEKPAAEPAADPKSE